MLIPPEEGISLLFDGLYGVIKEDASSTSGCTVLLFVAPNCDSICACRIVTTLLRTDDIPYKVLPVAGYEDLYTSMRQERSNKQLKSVFLIGCGATVDVSEIFDLGEFPSLMVYVIDSHRPVHLNNISNSEQVVVLYNGNPRADEIPAPDDIDRARKEVEEEFGDRVSEDSSEYEEEDVVDDGILDRDEDEDAFLVDGDDDEDELHSRGTTTTKRTSAQLRGDYEDARSKRGKRAKTTNASPSVLQYSTGVPHRQQWNLKLAELLRKRATTRIERNYYSREHSGDCGASSAMLCYTLASQTNHRSSDLLWLAILGLTDQWLHGMITYRRYKHQHEKLLGEVHHFHHSESEMADGVGPMVPRGSSKLVISKCDEYMFPLYRHWNLHDSMYHSRYVASRLGIWKSQGKRNLEVLLAKAGISLVEARQSFSSMSKDAKSMMRMHLDGQASHFNLAELSYPSFSSRHAASPTLCAADVVYSVTCLLEFAHGMDRAGDASVYEDNFWRAYASISTDALRKARPNASSTPIAMAHGGGAPITPSSRGGGGGGGGGYSPTIYDGISLAIQLHQLVVHLGASIIEKGIIVHSGPFRYAFVPECSERALFSHALSLKTLGLFLVEYLNQCKPSRKPLLLLCLDTTTQSYMIAAMANTHSFSNFGVCFQKAARRTKAHICHHAFDTSVVCVDHSDTHKFLDYMLYYVMLRGDGEEDV